MNEAPRKKLWGIPWWFRGTAPPRWRKIKNREAGDVELFLRRRESWYAGACGRFLNRNPRKDQIWAWREYEGFFSALFLYSKRTMVPVFNGKTNIPLSRFILRHFRMAPVHAVQGLREEALAVEEALAETGFAARETIDYDLMALDTEPPEENFRAGPPELVLRPPVVEDMNTLFTLQEGYEKEEVLPAGAVFNSVSCRLGLLRMLEKGQILAAEMDGRMVGKINTSAVSFTRCLIGGVYVHPDYRGRGIARRMIAEFTRNLISQGWGTTLFVKKKNAAARSVYRRTGFQPFADYRISYY
ncbi:MAG: GNAT family N-acetyltransferase [Treponema sp.]|jgi:predicted GNAT family acetyltransferase|nr:GNAT family N-acetyltransferase [Treponema sp.]